MIAFRPYEVFLSLMDARGYAELGFDGEILSENLFSHCSVGTAVMSVHPPKGGEIASALYEIQGEISSRDFTPVKRDTGTHSLSQPECCIDAVSAMGPQDLRKPGVKGVICKMASYGWVPWGQGST